MEQEKYITPFVLKYNFEYSIRNIHVSKEGLKLNQHLFFVVKMYIG